MIKSVKTAKLVGALVVLLAATTLGLRAAQPGRGVDERQAIVTELGAGASATTYWVAKPDGWHVVTTVDTVSARDSDAETHAVVRFSSVLLPGQSQTISVPFAAGEQQQVLRIRRLEDRIEVALVRTSSA